MGIQQWWFVWGGSHIWYWLFFNHTWDVGGGDKHILVMGQNHNLHGSLEIVHSLFILCLGCSALSIDWLKMLCWYPLVKQFAIEHGHLVRWFTYIEDCDFPVRKGIYRDSPGCSVVPACGDWGRVMLMCRCGLTDAGLDRSCGINKCYLVINSSTLTKKKHF